MGAKGYSKVNVQRWELIGCMVGFLVVVHFGTMFAFSFTSAFFLDLSQLISVDSTANMKVLLFVFIIMDPVVFSMTKS